jgi:hypothetical protein
MNDKPEFPRPPLPSRETVLSKAPVHTSDEILGWSVVLGLILLVLLVAFLPRPAFQIEQVEFITTTCDPTSHSYQVTASMTIRNTGGVGGVATVHLLVDGQVAETGNYEVPPHEIIQRGLSAIVTNCQSHRFSVELFFPQSG